MANLSAAYDRFETVATSYGGLLLHVWARLWVALWFLASGVRRVMEWDNQDAAFSAESGSPVPLIPDGRITQWLGIDAEALILPPEIVKYIVTGGELIFPVLLTLGLLTRISGLMSLVMAVVIQFWVGSIKAGFYIEQHYFWMLAALVPIVLPPNALTLDYWLTRRQSLAMTGLVLALVGLWVIYISLL